MKKILILILGLSIVGSLLVAPVAFAQNSNSQACKDDGSNLLDIDTICNPATKFYVDFGHDQNTFQGLLEYIINGLLGLVGLVSIVFIIIGGFKYITSAGNEEQAESGKKTLTNAIIGLVIVILSYVIVVVVINALARKQF